MATERIWTDPHIGKMLLGAHLDGSSDAASRRPETIERTIGWIKDGIRPDGRVLDLGCGPGLYAEALAKSGFHVTGVDVNPYSIEHARSNAAELGLDISYVLGDYLELQGDAAFDAALCIYCDFGALDDMQEIRFLEMVRRQLVPGGRLAMDVFGPGLSDAMKEGRTSERFDRGGFWSPLPHELVVDTSFHSESDRWIRTCLLKEDGRPPRRFVLADRFFASDGIRSLLETNGFRLLEVVEGLIQPNEFTSSDVLFVLAERV